MEDQENKKNTAVRRPRDKKDTREEGTKRKPKTEKPTSDESESAGEKTGFKGKAKPAPRKDGEQPKKKQKYAKHGQKLWKRIRKEYKERKAARKQKESAKSREQRHEEEMHATLFLRNVPLSATEEDLEETFKKFGELRYAKMVKDKNTNLPKGTAFLCFKDRSSAEAMLEEAYPPYWDAGERKESCITLMGRQLGVAWAIQKEEADKIAQKTGSEKRREEKKVDKRNMGLAGIGYELSKEAMEQAGFSSIDIERRLVAKQEKLARLKNPNLFVSRTRLSVRYLPNGVDEKMLKMIARQAAISGLQHPHKVDEDDTDSEEEDEEDDKDEEMDEDEGEDDDEDEDEDDDENEDDDEDDDEDDEKSKNVKSGNKKEPRVVIKQVKIVKEKEKVDNKTGKAKLKNFGFVEFETHSMALAAQQMMNNRADLFVSFLKEKYPEGSEAPFKSRILVDFSVENIFALAKLQRTIQRGKDAQKRARESKGEDGEPASKRGRGAEESKPLTHKEKRAQRAHLYKQNLHRRHRAAAAKAKAAEAEASGSTGKRSSYRPKRDAKQ